ncbi:bifunctional 4-hydroxy-2-oxoglutarate aldolase/2-dehydro-3-deoxy-phosphogluconate aldolase [Rikenella microfusus]|uniref:KHG/KDPG aldolase n=1 Tax=Rikenella microfusus TaxID=28139 RepID=A0A379MUM2_9BACT|nr:bifunctional 4-hydroxy-2-oxoglutarate aldolase/2-dehydro-3-deoxy-phosphogluconate aldolase [Rikenella microfusus]SUE34459.1 KHG/KDPG aldolase [Rikenella microfusus]HJE88204.1 bifunctional 4-hydroxy-2-oxoglutarate aldolase/2-dehydro-3-deoxy-phosphogluconate aldolase [Rikenella microfusus]
MARFTRIEVALEMGRQGVIPVFYHADVELCKEVLKASYAAGIRVFEFTNRGDFAHEVFGTLNRWAATELPELMLGVGSVVDAPTAALYIQLGAAFVVSPLLNEEMAPVCNRRKILWAPGCGSLSEIGRAEELGAEIVKIFPGSSVGGPEFVKAVKGPCPWSSIMPTGGVEPTEESLGAWFKAGVTCVGMGSNLFPKKLIEAGDWAAITETIDRVRAIVAAVRR